VESVYPYRVYLFSMFACYVLVFNEMSRNKVVVPEDAAGVNTRISDHVY